jgi:hypothetical protein
MPEKRVFPKPQKIVAISFEKIRPWQKSPPSYSVQKRL